MADAAFTVLFLCTQNSARSIMAEALLNHIGKDHFVAYSAGTNPAGKIHPMALEVLAQNRISTDTLRSKSWNEFAQLEAPELDFIITVCDQAAGETCPVLPGQPLTAHWGIVDPATAQGSDAQRRHAFFTAFNELSQRVRILTDLPVRSLDRIRLHEHLRLIGTTGDGRSVA
jgi:arsenate reductase